MHISCLLVSIIMDLLILHCCFLDSPSIKILPTLSDFIKGSLAILSCQASGIPKPKLTWSKNGHQNIPETHVKQEVDSKLLMFQSIQLEHSGVYTCTATNQFGNASTSTNVTVIGKVTYSSCFLVYYHHLNFRFLKFP